MPSAGKNPKLGGVTCPHCSQSIRGKQRTNSACDLCKKEFAFDPKTNPFRLHDVRFRKVAEHMGAGGFKFTAGQLGVALTRRPTSATGTYLAAALFGVFGLAAAFLSATSATKGAEKGVLFGIAWMIAGAVLAGFASSNPPATPKKEAMQTDILPRWCSVHGEPPRGLIDEASLASLTEDDRPLKDLVAVVVCPERDVLTSLLANGAPRDLRLGLLPTAPPTNPWEEGLIEMLRKNPRLPILLLHDASAEGVFLARDLPKLLGLDPKHRILDLGLNVRKSIAKRRTVVLRPVTAEIMVRLDGEAVGADVAGSRPIRRGRAQATPKEMVWLKTGNCSPILAVPPVSLVKRLKFTLAKFVPRKVRSKAEAELLKRLSAKKPTAAEAAAAAGFMNEPA